MAIRQDLVGTGMPDALARRVGYTSPAISVTAAGTTSVDATVLKGSQNNVKMIATGSDGIRMPAEAELMHPYFVANTSASTGKVYPPTGSTWNGGTTDLGISLLTVKSMVCYHQGTNLWAYIMSA